jgi:membrane protease YdiL (CAAX protease family)
MAHAVEFLLLFIGGPALFAYTRHRIPAIPALWVLMAWCLYVLLHDSRFDRAHLWDADAFWHYAPQVLGLFGFVLFIGVVLIRRHAPELFLGLPRSKPRVWGALMVLYPVLSVYPQGIVFRAFIFDRYRDLFGPGWAIVTASAVAFAWVHIVFHNKLALILTGLGGVLFGLRYLQTGSLFISSFEHALYGCAIFTIGIGRSFYHAAMRQSAIPESARTPTRW